MRAFAAVLFRRMAAKMVKKPDPKDLFISLDMPQKTHIRSVMIFCFLNETQHTVRNKIGDAIADLARQGNEYGMALKQEELGSLAVNISFQVRCGLNF